MSAIKLEAASRSDIGKGASRRLRRLDNKVPAVLYGGGKEPVLIDLAHNKVIKALDCESIYSSVFDLIVDGKVHHVILKDLQRHPYKPVILHMDFQRVSATDKLVRMVPIHFINEKESKGVKAGGIINHTMTQVEIRCAAKDLPEFIEIDIIDVDLDDVLHMTDIKLPKGVKFAIDPSEGNHDHPVLSIHVSKADISELAQTEEVVEEEIIEEVSEEEQGASDAE